MFRFAARIDAWALSLLSGLTQRLQGPLYLTSAFLEWSEFSLWRALLKVFSLTILSILLMRFSSSLISLTTLFHFLTLLFNCFTFRLEEGSEDRREISSSHSSMAPRSGSSPPFDSTDSDSE